MLLYFDESGNTGSNWLDKQQPYFVYGGWLMLDSKKELAVQLLAKSFSDSKATELKSKKIWNKKRNQLIEFINGMINEVKAIPSFGIVDKKYMVAAKIIETFFDCAYNPFVNTYLTNKSELKKALADSLSKNDTIINTFAELIKQGTIDLKKMQFIKKEMQKYFEKISEKVSELIKNLTDDSLVEMISEFEEITKNGTAKKWISLVEPIMFERIINCLNCFYGSMKESWKIYVDQLFGFNDVFNRLNNVINNKKICTQDIKILMCDSKSEPLIQAADLLCGFILHSFLEISEVSSSYKINELWKDLICIRDEFSKNNIIVWEFFTNEDAINLISELAGGSRIETISPELIINKYIEKAIK